MDTTTLTAPAASQPYRPHDPGNDYYDRGIYLITLVVRSRDRLLATLNADPRQPESTPTDIGRIILSQWSKTPSLQLRHGNSVELIEQCVMPDHWHGVIKVNNHMSWSLGDIVQAVKASCTRQWRELMGVSMTEEESSAIRLMSHRQRLAYYAALPRSEQPLFDDNYDDTICLTDPATGLFDQRHLKAMVGYVLDNPRRAIIRRLRPDFMRRCLHITLGGRDYAAFGNLFLLRWTRKVQVFCHRRDPQGRPYETTQAYRDERDRWLAMVMQGQTVIVTPGISRGELLMKKECLSRGLPLIHLQKEPIGPYWKPEKERFDAMTKGYLLILAPWQPEQLGEVNGVPATTDYSQFHNLNNLAHEICTGVITDMRIK